MLFAVSTAHAQVMCSDVMKPTVTVAQFEAITGKSVQAYIERFKAAISPNVLAGEKTPGWSDFQSIKELIHDLKSLKAELKEKPETAHMLESLSAELKDLLLNETSTQQLLEVHKANKGQYGSYQPTEREMKLAYQFYVRELNKVLPRNLRVPLSRLKSDARKAKIQSDALTYIKGLENHYRNNFDQSTYKSYEGFIESLHKNENPLVKKAIEIVEKDQLQVVMRRPENARFWAPKVGFQNQFVTGSSRGALSPHYRNMAERNLFDLENLDTYSTRDAEFKPKYGTLSVKPESGVNPDLNASSQYGPDIYSFKTEKIQDRLTFYISDSLFPGYSAKDPDTSPWEKYFIPWKYRMFAVPFIASKLQTNTFKVGPPLQGVLDPSVQINGFNYIYWETQILGQIRIEDVSQFTFTNALNPPRGEFLRELLKHNIEIYDGSAGLGPEQIKRWTPSKEDLQALN
jgi:hypothetical protein